MCLGRQLKKPDRPGTKRRPVHAWRIDRIPDVELYGKNYKSLYGYGGKPVPKGRWVHEKEYRNKDVAHNRKWIVVFRGRFTAQEGLVPAIKYEIGFHAIRTREQARAALRESPRKYRITKVALAGVVAVDGLQLCAKWMKYPKKGRKV